MNAVNIVCWLCKCCIRGERSCFNKAGQTWNFWKNCLIGVLISWVMVFLFWLLANLVFRSEKIANKITKHCCLSQYTFIIYGFAAVCSLNLKWCYAFIVRLTVIHCTNVLPVLPTRTWSTESKSKTIFWLLVFHEAFELEIKLYIYEENNYYYIYIQFISKYYKLNLIFFSFILIENYWHYLHFLNLNCNTRIVCRFERTIKLLFPVFTMCLCCDL